MQGPINCFILTLSIKEITDFPWIQSFTFVFTSGFLTGTSHWTFEQSIYSNTVLKYHFEANVLYSNISMFYSTNISQGNTVLFYSITSTDN